MSGEYSTSPKIRVRIESLSDLVFGLALSIGSLTLIGKLPQTAQDLATDIVLFGFSFLIVVLIWTGYTRTMAILSVDVRGAFILNLALLFGVALEPFLFYVLQSQTAILDIVSEAYALDIGAMSLILGVMVYLALSEEKRMKDRKIHPILLKRLNRILIADIVAGSTFFISALPFLWIPLSIGFNLRFDIWYASFAIFFAQRYMPLRDPGA